MKKYGFSIWISVIAIVLISFLVVFAFHYHDDQAIKNYKTTAQCHLDSISRENAALRKALSEKLISHCDTMTVDQKLAQQELDDYTYKMYEIREAQKSRAYSQKEIAESKAYQAKESSDQGWETYSKIRSQATLELERTDPVVFATYAVIIFKEEKCYSDSYEFNRSLYESREKMEKDPKVAKYLKKVKDADAIRSKQTKEVENKYHSRLTEIDQKYKAQLATIEDNYNKKIAAKKTELGL